jgi:hypothetical protein
MCHSASVLQGYLRAVFKLLILHIAAIAIAVYYYVG